MHKTLSLLMCAFCFFSAAVSAQSKVTLNVDTKSKLAVIPDDFTGLSWEATSIEFNHNGVKGYFFDASNKQGITLFKNIGLKNLRVGGATVDHLKKSPDRKDIDALFSFVKEAGLRVIYSFQMTNGNIGNNASDAKYIWKKYKKYIQCFSIGNEPDWHSFHIIDPEITEAKSGVPGTAFPTYIAKWKRFALAIKDSVPQARFGNPNTGSNFPVEGTKDTYYNGKSWTVNFAEATRDMGIVNMIFLHNYVGQSAQGTPEEMIDKMLSPTWPNVRYPQLFEGSVHPVLNLGLPYRLTESNSFSGEVKEGSNSFATSLFALDYLHWWALHKASGVNFHNKQWIYNNTITMDKNGDFQVYPMAYGIRAFNMGGHGVAKSLSIANSDSLNLTAYAVKDKSYLYVTIINKEHGKNKRQADVEITLPEGKIKSASLMRLVSKTGEASATTGVTLGGEEIHNSIPWQGKWTGVGSFLKRSLIVNVPASSAAIIRIKY